MTSDERLEEIRRASRYPKFKEVLQPTRVGTMVNNLQRTIVLERLNIEIEVDDPDDAFLLAIAIAGDADYLVLETTVHCCNAKALAEPAKTFAREASHQPLKMQ